jgi:hypothetical protein
LAQSNYGVTAVHGEQKLAGIEEGVAVVFRRSGQVESKRGVQWEEKELVKLMS